MAELVVLEGPARGRRIALGRETRLAGAGPGALLPGENALAQSSVSVTRVAEGYRLVTVASDLVRVNELVVREVMLRHGDMVRIGASALLFSEETAPATATRSAAPPSAAASPPLAVGAPAAAEEGVPGIRARRRAFDDESSVVQEMRARDRDAQRLVALYRIGHAIGNVRQLAPLLDRVLEILFEELPADRGMVYLVDEMTRTLKTAASRIREGSGPLPSSFSRTILREALQTHEAILTADAMDDPRFREGLSISSQHIVSAMCAPLTRKGKFIGLLALDTVQEARAFSEDDLDLLRGIAAQASVAIENAQILERDKRTQLRLRLLNRAAADLAAHLDHERIWEGLVTHAAGIVGCRRVSLLVPSSRANPPTFRIAAARGLGDDAQWRNAPLPANATLAGHVLAHGEALNLADVAAAPGGVVLNRDSGYRTPCCLLVPVRSESGSLEMVGGVEILGILCLSDKLQGKRFSEEDERFMGLLAGYAATVLTNAILYERATVEPLTGLDTRSFFFVQAEDAWARLQAKGEPLSMLLMDLDHFKQVNDRLGHPAGDEVLRGSGRLIRGLLRPGERAGRYGGEELLVLLPGIAGEALAARAESFRRAFAEAHFPPLEGPGRVTVSVGAGTWCVGEEGHDFVRRVDAALYRAKQGGRNRIEVAQPYASPIAAR